MPFNYGRDPVTDVRELIQHEIEANKETALGFLAQAEEHEDRAAKLRANVARFLEPNDRLAAQAALLEREAA